jgi:hypothetical protein
MISQRYIDFQFDELDPNSEKVKPIREGFMNMLTQMIGELNQSTDNKPPTPEEAEAMPDIKTGTSYKFVREKFVRKVQMGIEVLNLNYRSTYYNPVDITQNLNSWYNNLKANPRCVGSVNLNDPFFERRDINFILDETTNSMFEDKEVNYVTVNVRKKRSSGNDFTGRITIDKKNLGERARLTYARGDDNNSGEPEYQLQWSFAGGNLYPQNPTWQKAAWEANTLAAPLIKRKIEFQTDLEKLKEAKIVRAQLQLRFKKFGDEREVTLPLSSSATDPLLSKNIYSDKDLDGFAYRVMYYTSEGEKLGTEWKADKNAGEDWYVFAAVPDELKDKTSELFKKAVEIGKAVTGGTTEGGKVSEANKVLEKFADVLGIIKN